MDDKTFILFAKQFLKLSLEDIDYNYEELSSNEKYFISEKDFEEFVKKIKEYPTVLSIIK